MADENVIIEENEQNVGEYDPNPYDNVTVEEALKQLFNRFTPRTVRQAIFTMAENNKPATLIEKSITENGEYNASSDNADGYSSVTVDVDGGGGGETFEVNLTLTFTEDSEFDVSSSEAFNDIMTAFDNGAKLNLVITLIDGGNTSTLSNVMYSKMTEGSKDALIVFGFLAQVGWFRITWSGDVTIASMRQSALASVEMIAE